MRCATELLLEAELGIGRGERGRFMRRGGNLVTAAGEPRFMRLGGVTNTWSEPWDEMDYYRDCLLIF